MGWCRKKCVILRIENMTRTRRAYNSFVKRCRGNIVTVLLTVLFASYYSGSTLFIHTHFLGLGHGPITHSHPYLPGNHHSHSANEIDAIASLTDFVAEEVQFVDVPANEEILLNVLYSQPVSECAAADQFTIGPRAPPACFI